ncbi:MULTISPECIES: patatin-like phospholipase family protein [Deefgea]|uniref:Patatin-like phospholipase family protein n=1 Tax=Deefgea chitinilytica TaxID=570276 RepID=A0ABS2CFK1_9NEIS|nr:MULTISPECIES: patatin-like phospholipase family protein [Deefgea]MBM5572440.1 patatin-like phospholipase family protein [Deefgea chitinilytica]MBM9889676.1 patatin-like phospholipase family protein [Deefgea sp. CFH1-16]
MAARKRKIAITCQGGGSQTAFTAGALKALYDNGFAEHFELVSITGTSGGALCATLIWYAMLNKDAYIPQRMLDLWADNTAQSDAELQFNNYVVDSLRKVNSGQIPQFNISPYSPLMQMMSSVTGQQFRRNFTDFRALLESHIDFAALKAMGPNTELPALILGAAEVLTGQLSKFNSRTEAIRVEHILSSCAVPNIFEAVEFDGKAYWDGLFSDNPPVDEVIRPIYVGENNIPEEIWVIKINPNGCKEVPKTPEAIADRRNEMIGNMSLFQQLASVRTLNELLLKNAFTPEFLALNGVKAPIKIPRCLSMDETRPYHIPFLEMSTELQSTLDYESKLDRSPKNIRPLMADGESQGKLFITERIAALKP